MHRLPTTRSCFKTKECPYWKVCVCIRELIIIFWKNIRFAWSTLVFWLHVKQLYTPNHVGWHIPMLRLCHRHHGNSVSFLIINSHYLVDKNWKETHFSGSSACWNCWNWNLRKNCYCNLISFIWWLLIDDTSRTVSGHSIVLTMFGWVGVRMSWRGYDACPSGHLASTAPSMVWTHRHIMRWSTTTLVRYQEKPPKTRKGCTHKPFPV